ncbi:MAG TPA: DUF3151 family protein [Acidimicrobiales bacterium]|nr:DUF3151 family protein [Acidimicrobiales bacterium]
MADAPVSMSASGPPETVLAPEPADVLAALAEAGDDRDAVAAVVARWPRSLVGWARLGSMSSDPVEAYAYFRVGYHRGLDALRGSGWRGSGYVRWQHETNRGFLRALAGLAATAAAIGETDEHERCATFLRQLDPAWPPDDLGG